MLPGIQTTCYLPDISSNSGSPTGRRLGAKLAGVVSSWLILIQKKINVYMLAESFQLSVITQFKTYGFVAVIGD